MAKISEMIESKYLKQSDFPDPLIVTVSKIGQLNIAKEGDPADMKWAVRFREFPKPMLLNSTNIKLLEKACGSDDTDDWIGKEVIVYTDDSVSFGGQIVGGLRVRKQESAPTRKATTTTTPAPASGGGSAFDDVEDDIPF